MDGARVGAQGSKVGPLQNQFALYSQLFGGQAPQFTQREVDMCPVDTEAWDALTKFSRQQFEASARELIAAADAFVAGQLKMLQAYKEEILRQADGNGPEASVALLSAALTECRQMRSRLSANEQGLQRAFDDPLARLFASLVCACREHSEQSAQVCPGTNINLELMKFTSSVHATLRSRKEWVDRLCASRQLQCAQLCERLEGDLEDALAAAIDGDDDDDAGSMLDGSITDLLSTFDDLATMTTISSAASAVTGASRISARSGTGAGAGGNGGGGGGGERGDAGGVAGSDAGSMAGGAGPYGSVHGSARGAAPPAQPPLPLQQQQQAFAPDAGAAAAAAAAPVAPPAAQ